MRNFVLSAVFSLFVISSLAGVSLAQPSALYDAGTGQVTFEDVENLVGLRINSSLGELIFGEATTLGGATDGAFGVLNDQAPNFIEWGNLTGMTFASESAGNIFSAGLQQGQLDSGFEFLYRTVASPTVDVVGAITGGAPVPEPTTLALASLGMIGLLSTRRRRS